MNIQKKNAINMYKLPEKVIFVKNVQYQIKDLGLVLMKMEFVPLVILLILKI